MKITDLAIGLVAALAAAGPGAARAAGNEVVIGDIDDLSGVYSDEGGTVLVDLLNRAGKHGLHALWARRASRRPHVGFGRRSDHR